MQISKKMDVNATPEQIDDKLNRLDEMAGDKVPNLKAERNSDGTYTFKSSLKMGLFPIKIKVDLAIKPVKRLSNYDLELKSKLFGKKLDGEGSLAIRAQVQICNRDRVDIRRRFGWNGQRDVGRRRRGP